jgi:hypothetical protein
MCRNFFCVGGFFVCALFATSAFAQVTDSRSKDHVFAQFALGRFPDGSYYRSTLIVATEASLANCDAKLVGLTVPGWGSDGSGGTFRLASTTAFIIVSDGKQGFQSGFLNLHCDQPVAAQVLYGDYSQSGNLISQATVFSSPAATMAQFVADYRESSQLGIALANTSTTTKTFVVAAFKLATSTTEAPQEITRTTVQLTTGSHTARFANELLQLPSDFVGLIRIWSDTAATADVYTIGLKYTGQAFTTIPALAGTSKPKPCSGCCGAKC